MMSITFHKPDGTPDDSSPLAASRLVMPVKKMGPPVRTAIPKATDLPNEENSAPILAPIASPVVQKIHPEIREPEKLESPPAAPKAGRGPVLPAPQPTTEVFKYKDVEVTKQTISEGIQVPNFGTPPKSAPAPFEVKSFTPKKSPVKP
ncbi:MAG: hypothetical protein HC845_09790 [Akkermansiaceae bacterium]|nr:hypothetical protein [Akkermansiaceae bacterium]